MTKTGQLWILPSQAVVKLNSAVDARGRATNGHTGDWNATYFGGSEVGTLSVSDAFLTAHGVLMQEVAK